MTRTFVLLIAIVLSASSLFWGFQHLTASPLPLPTASNTNTQISTTYTATIEAGRAAKQTLNLAQMLTNTSLADTQVPGSLTIDALGRLIPDNHSKAVMDYFLSLSGEMPDASIRRLLEHWARHNAGQLAAADLLTLFDQYHYYRSRLANGDYAAHYLNKNSGDIRNKLEQRQKLRNDTFGTDIAAALFADEDRYDRVSLQRNQILTSRRSEKEKADALQELRKALPEALAKQHQRQYDLQRLTAHEQSIKQQGANAADLYAFRQRQFGDAAALRLQALDEQRTLWQSQYQNYARQRDQINSAAIDIADKQKQLQALRSRLFTHSEQQRAAALDRMQ